tara:strand:- start:193 stop:330 length:138 start_codon:yes stop_codon:yes gene_type:complete
MLVEVEVEVEVPMPRKPYVTLRPQNVGEIPRINYSFLFDSNEGGG